MQDEALLRVIAEIPQQPQRQYGADEQLRILRLAANKLGLYDAADRLQLEDSLLMQRVNLIWRKRS